MGIDESGTTGKLGQLAHELACAMDNDGRPVPGLVALGDVDLARQNDNDAGTYTPDRYDRITWLVGADVAKSAHALDLFGLQHRKHLVASRINDRARRKGHMLFRSL